MAQTGFTIITWVDEANGILAVDSANNDTPVISRSGVINSFDVIVTGDFDSIEAEVWSIPVSVSDNRVTVSAANFAPGEDYQLLVIVRKGIIPYSAEIYFNVVD